MTTPSIVSGAISAVSELGKDEAWLQGWFREQPTRLGLGDIVATDDEVDDERSFVATDDERCFSVDVQLGEMEPSRGFGVLDNWARSRVRHPDKSHVAVLVTEAIDDRYRTTLETLAEHLPLLVVELQVWRGENEAIVVPHIALSSDAVDLSATPAAKAAKAVKAVSEAPAHDEPAEPQATEDGVSEDQVTEDQAVTSSDGQSDDGEAGVASDGDGESEGSTVVPENKDDTGVKDPWGLPQAESYEAEAESNGSGRHRLLNKIGQ